MKNNKTKIIVISLVILIITIIGIVIFNFYKGYKEDKIQTQEKIDNINENYNIFINNIDKFNEKREIIYNEILKDNYYTEINNNIENWNKKMKEYEQVVQKIEEESKYLKENCLNLKIYNPEIDRKCNSYIENYERIINYYISDINLYNENIDSYNNWVYENNDETYKIADKYIDNNHNEYIDFNNDGEFVGKA